MSNGFVGDEDAIAADGTVRAGPTGQMDTVVVLAPPRIPS